ncbi:SEL1 protein [Klebsormidium nitens]|uniref:SEL1 protein n=1 Tax=Klebsormidium nitens TaxID=105231 RepID=A0A1Y1I514_KLENI|nr:SEL1 protein [Klebsormidium nitens]|eukprot:GAQ83796.1 SEL1 protein [Klebsormidium nitens]
MADFRALPEEVVLLILQRVVASSGQDFVSVSLVSKQFRKLARDTHCAFFESRLGRTRSAEKDKVHSFVAFLKGREDLESLTLKDVAWLHVPLLRKRISKLPNAFYDDARCPLNEAIGTLHSLVELRMSENKWWLPVSLESLTSLTSLDLSGSKLNGREKVLSVQSLGQLRALTALDLSNNPVGFEGAQSLAPVLQSLPALKSLKLEARTEYNIGLCYYNGKGVAEDEEAGVRWFRKAAERGNADGQNHLGWCYLHGSGVETDLARAEKWLTKAAEQDHSDAQCSLGSLFKLAAKPDYARSLKWYTERVQKMAMHKRRSALPRPTLPGKASTEIPKWLRGDTERLPTKATPRRNGSWACAITTAEGWKETTTARWSGLGGQPIKGILSRSTG